MFKWFRRGTVRVDRAVLVRLGKVEEHAEKCLQWIWGKETTILSMARRMKEMEEEQLDLRAAVERLEKGNNLYSEGDACK